MIANFAGIRLVESPHAERTVIEFKVQSWPIRKRRRAWRVVRTERREPCAYFMSDHAIVHPLLMNQLAKFVGRVDL